MDINTLEIKKEKEEKLLAFFKLVYKESERKWNRLEINDKFFILKELEINYDLIINYNRKRFTINNYLDLWLHSCEKIDKNNLNFLNNQNYAMSEKIKREVLKYRVYTNSIPF